MSTQNTAQQYAKLLGQTTVKERKRVYLFIEDTEEIEKWSKAFEQILGVQIELRPKAIMAGLKVVFALAAIAASSNVPIKDVEAKVKQLFG
jgi:hypothetical protein